MAAGAAEAGQEEERLGAEAEEVELEVASIICGLKSILQARDRRRRRRQARQRRGEEIPSWGRRRLRSVLGGDGARPSSAVSAPERDGGGAASPDTPLAFFPESGGDDAPEQEPAEDDTKAAAQAESAQEQRGVVATLSQEKTRLLKEIEEYTARLQSTRSANESLQQQVQQSREHQEPPASRALRLDLNEPAPRLPEDEARAAAAEWYRRGQLMHHAAMQRAAAAASARRRRLDYMRSVASCRSRRVAG